MSVLAISSIQFIEKKINPIVHIENCVSASGEPSDRIRIWYTCLEVLLAKRGLIRDRE